MFIDPNVKIYFNRVNYIQSSILDGLYCCMPHFDGIKMLQLSCLWIRPDSSKYRITYNECRNN